MAGEASAAAAHVGATGPDDDESFDSVEDARLGLLKHKTQRLRWGSRYVGVTRYVSRNASPVLSCQRWQGRTIVNGKWVYVGYFSKQFDAALAVRAATLRQEGREQAATKIQTILEERLDKAGFVLTAFGASRKDGGKPEASNGSRSGKGRGRGRGRGRKGATPAERDTIVAQGHSEVPRGGRGRGRTVKGKKDQGSTEAAEADADKPEQNSEAAMKWTRRKKTKSGTVDFSIAGFSELQHKRIARLLLEWPEARETLFKSPEGSVVDDGFQRIYWGCKACRGMDVGYGRGPHRYDKTCVLTHIGKAKPEEGEQRGSAESSSDSSSDSEDNSASPENVGSQTQAAVDAWAADVFSNAGQHADAAGTAHGSSAAQMLPRDTANGDVATAYQAWTAGTLEAWKAQVREAAETAASAVLQNREWEAMQAIDPNPYLTCRVTVEEEFARREEMKKTRAYEAAGGDASDRRLLAAWDYAKRRRKARSRLLAAAASATVSDSIGHGAAVSRELPQSFSDSAGIAAPRRLAPVAKHDPYQAEAAAK